MKNNLTILCACGCETRRSRFDKYGIERRYIIGHISRGKPMSEEHKQKISQAKIGSRHSEATKRKIGDTMRGKYTGEKHPRWKGDEATLKAKYARIWRQRKREGL